MAEDFGDAGGAGDLLGFVVDGDVSAAVDDVPCGDGGVRTGPEEAGGGAVAAGDADDGGLYFVVDVGVELEVCARGGGRDEQRNGSGSVEETAQRVREDRREAGAN